MLISLIRLVITIGIAFLAGKLVSKLKLPSILGWLITGMILGPHALSLMSQEILDAQWYQTVVHILECGVGLMISTELVWNKIKKSLPISKIFFMIEKTMPKHRLFIRIPTEPKACNKLYRRQ